ncbi:hypothetical protein MKW98_005540, partial [Papaver atlanticum]
MQYYCNKYCITIELQKWNKSSWQGQSPIYASIKLGLVFHLVYKNASHNCYLTLPQNTTISPHNCRSTSSFSLSVVQDSSQILELPSTMKFIWKIHNFTKLNNKVYQYSDVFSAGGAK